MSGIHDLIIEKIIAELQKVLIDDIAADDNAKAGVVMAGPLPGQIPIQTWPGSRSRCTRTIQTR